MAYFPLAIALFLLLSIVFQGYRGYRRVRAGLPAVEPPSALEVWLRNVVFAVLGGIAVWVIVARLLAPH